MELTSKGRSILEQAVQANTAAECQRVAGLEPAELETLAVLVKKLLAGLGAQGDGNS